MARLYLYIDLNPDGSGTLTEEKEFKDGTSSSTSITYNPDNTGTYTKNLRNGNQVSGTFNIVEDDMKGSLTETINFPEGRYIDKINKSVEITLIPPDSISVDYQEYRTFSSGRIDSIQININARENEETIYAKYEILKRNGAHGTLYLEQSDESITLSGDWTTWNGYYIVIDNTVYDLSENIFHIHYKVYASVEAFNNNEDPILIADFVINEEYASSGTMTYNDIIYNITFQTNGTATIESGGKSTKINLYQ